MFILLFSVDFLLQNLWWIILLGVVVLLGLIWLISFLISKNPKKRKGKVGDIDIFTYLGGKDNVLSFTVHGSRLIIKLKNKNLLQREELKALGVKGFVEKEEDITIVLSNELKERYKDYSLGE